MWRGGLLENPKTRRPRLIMENKDEAQQKRDQEKKKKQASCSHENSYREKIGSFDTGDKLCLDCGKTI
jgi:hypothetical protein